MSATNDTAGDDRSRRIAIGFLNFAHAVDHYVMLIFPTVVIGLVAAIGPRASEAQSPASTAAMVGGPSGVWVMSGNKLYICDVNPVRGASVDPPTPRCGAPLTLR